MIDNLALRDEIRELTKLVKLLDKDIKKLHKKVDDIDARIKVLEGKDIYDILGVKREEPNEQPNPWAPKIESSPFVPDSPWITPVYVPKTCSKCGLKLEKVMGYSCPHIDCPVGLGPVMCGGNNV